MVRRLLPLIVLSAMLAASQPVLSQEQETPAERAERLAREGLERFLKSIEAMIEWLPQYEMPEVLENGDIIIRRKQPAPDEGEPLDQDTTRT